MSVRVARNGLIHPVVVLTGMVMVIGLAFGLIWTHWAGVSAQEFGKLPRMQVHRSDLVVSVRAPGRVDSSKKTLIECELENMVAGTRGRYIATSGASTILTIIPDGSQVEAGEVLCRLDASEYEELVRQQEIKVQEERAQYDAALLSLKTAETGLKEFEEGLLLQSRQQYSGQIALSKAELENQRNRLDWTESMVELGYLAPSKGAAERIALDRAFLSLDQIEMSRQNFERFGIARTVLNLKSRIDGARSVLTYQQMSLTRNEERLASLRKQVERCTIRAPHAGFVVYANEDDHDTRVEVGARVRQKQDLFYLPDLAHMEVWTQLHESIVDRVREGMQARIRVEALRDMILEGHVISVAPLAQSQTSWRVSPDVKNFLGKVQFDAVPPGLLPGMTAEVEILTANRSNVLVIPPGALKVEQGQDYCYVLGPEGPERRKVDIGAVTPDALEVVSGLDEGEEVFLEPGQIDPSLVVDRSEPRSVEPMLARSSEWTQ